MKKILDIIVENLTNERLDSLVFANDEYKKIMQKFEESSQIFEDSLTPEQHKKFVQFMDDYNAQSALYARLAYKQGMRDVAELWQELTEK